MNTSGKTLTVAAMFLLLTEVSSAGQIEVLWLGHSTTRITSTTGKVIVIDPFLKKNPKTPLKYKNLTALGKVDLILVTHGHRDHMEDLVELARLTGAIVVANWEYSLQLVKLGLLDAEKTVAMNKGGTVAPLGRGIKIHMVPADHSSSVDVISLGVAEPDPLRKEMRFFAGGVAVGYVVELENGFKIYHSGDTNVFGDMGLIHALHAPDLALVCIGGTFTMGPEGAAYALRELIKPKLVLPIHYGTFPVVNRTPAELKAALGDAPMKVLELKPGEAARF
jgi:L-ascorbate metabolism protein UlaG (beta-lactamase superfamily)